MSPIAKGLGVLFGFPLVLGIVFSYYFISTGEERMRAVCVQVNPGMTFTQLVAFAQEHNLDAPSKDSAVVNLGELRHFGGHTCRIALDAGIVKRAEYTSSD